MTVAIYGFDYFERASQSKIFSTQSPTLAAIGYGLVRQMVFLVALACSDGESVGIFVIRYRSYKQQSVAAAAVAISERCVSIAAGPK